MFLTKEFLSLQVGSSLRKKKKIRGPAGWKNGRILSHAEPVKFSVLLLRERFGETPWSDPCAGQDIRAMGSQF